MYPYLAPILLLQNIQYSRYRALKILHPREERGKIFLLAGPLNPGAQGVGGGAQLECMGFQF